jgi:hypothetical protein|tara:strand:+ start:61762 stop:62505 length:744 start_codon:yes stop_codon:yes gene_type:complete
VAEKLAPVVDDLSEALSIAPCFVDPAVGKFGLENTLLAVGSKFIEVVAPVEPNTAAGRFLERRGGDGGYMVICQSPTLQEQAQLRQRAQQADVRIAYESDRSTWNIMQLHPADMGASFLEFDWDEEEDVTGNWHPAGGKAWKNKVNLDGAFEIVAVELQGSDPLGLARRWADIMALPLESLNGIPTVKLANAEIRFVADQDGRGDGLSALDFKVRNREHLLAKAEKRGVQVSGTQLTICGTRLNLTS